MENEFMNKIKACLEQYQTELNDKDIQAKTSQILESYPHQKTIENLKFLCSCIDLTSLNTTDNSTSIKEFVNKVNEFSANFPEVPNVAAICVYPSLVSAVKEALWVSEVDIASVSAGFPSSQTFIEVKIAETSLAVYAGANEIDVVIPVGEFLKGNYVQLFDEISEIKAACGEAKLKVILETGALITASNIKTAAILAMEAGADFIKTSTGKMSPAATVEAAYVMVHAIKEFYEKSNRMVGFKPAGGISTTEEALKYYTIVKKILGDAWLTPEYFRIGASRLANHLLSDIHKMEGLDEDGSYF